MSYTFPLLPEKEYELSLLAQRSSSKSTKKQQLKSEKSVGYNQLDSTYFRSEMSMEELGILLRKVMKVASTRYNPVIYFHRNKPAAYWKAIGRTDQTMHPYIKDNSGVQQIVLMTEQTGFSSVLTVIPMDCPLQGCHRLEMCGSIYLHICGCKAAV